MTPCSAQVVGAAAGLVRCPAGMAGAGGRCPAQLVAGAGGVIPWSAGRVCLLDNGQEGAELCLQSTEPLPDSDLVILHKLMIEGNEHEYLTRANHFAPGGDGLRVSSFHLAHVPRDAVIAPPGHHS